MLPQLMEVQMNWRNRKFRWVGPAYTELNVRYAFTDPPAKGPLAERDERREKAKSD
jgi:hypothetical protein